MKDGLRLGYVIGTQTPVTFDGDSHSTVFAPTGSGKTTEFVVNNVLAQDKTSLLIPDGKCEIAPITIAHREKLGPVYLFNSYNMHERYLGKYPKAQYNPMARLFDPNEPRVNHGGITDKITEAWIECGGDSDNGRFFAGGAQGLTGGIILAQARYGPPDERNLIAVRRILAGDVIGYCERMIAKGDPLVNDRLMPFVIGQTKPGEKTSLNDIIRTANIETRALADDAIAHMFARSTFTFSELKKRVCTVYICMNIDFLHSGGNKVFRSLINCAHSELLKENS